MKKTSFIAIVVALVGFVACAIAAEVQENTQFAQDVRVRGTLTAEAAASAGTFTATTITATTVNGTTVNAGTSAVSGNQTVTGNSTISTWLRLPGRALTVNQDVAITATGSMILLTATNQFYGPAQTNTLAEPGVGNLGAILVVRNVGATNVLLVESATMITAGNITLGTDDAIAFSADTTNVWRELFRVNN